MVAVFLIQVVEEHTKSIISNYFNQRSMTSVIERFHFNNTDARSPFFVKKILSNNKSVKKLNLVEQPS